MALNTVQLQEFFSKTYGLTCRQGVEWLQQVEAEDGDDRQTLPPLRSEYVSCTTNNEALPYFTARLEEDHSSIDAYGHAEDLLCAPLGQNSFSCSSALRDFQFVIQRGDEDAYSMPFGSYVSYLETWAPRTKAMHNLIRQQFSGIFWTPASW